MFLKKNKIEKEKEKYDLFVHFPLRESIKLGLIIIWHKSPNLKPTQVNQQVNWALSDTKGTIIFSSFFFFFNKLICPST